MARTDVCAEEKILEKVDERPAKEADQRTITRLTDLDRVTVYRATGRLVGKKLLKPRIRLMQKGKEVHATLMYQIPEPLEINSPSLRILKAKKTDRDSRIILRMYSHYLAKDPQWQRLWMELEITSKLESALIEWEWGWRKNKRLVTAFYGENPDQIVERIVDIMHENGSAYNDLMKGNSQISWDKRQIKDIVNNLFERRILRINRSYGLKTSPELRRENERVRDSMQKIYDDTVNRLIVEGKWKIAPQVPPSEAHKPVKQHRRLSSN